MLRSILICALALAALPLAAKDFQWFPGGPGDDLTFSDPGNWYDLDPNVDPHSPSGPPGGSDNADLGSSATVSASGGSVKTLTGSGTSMLTLSGAFSAQEVQSPLTLAGSGMLTAQLVSIGPTIVGGHLTAESYTSRSLTVTSNGALIIKSPVQPNMPGDSFGITVRSGATLDIQGSALELKGLVEGGAQATITGPVVNRTVSKLTLSASGMGTSLSISEDCFMRDGSLDADGGASVSIGRRLYLEGVNSFTNSSNWRGAGTHVSAEVAHVGDFAGKHIVNMTDGAKLSTSHVLTVGHAAGSEGTLAAEGAATRVEASGTGVGIGASGKGTVSLRQGAQMTVAAGAFLAVGLAGPGELLVEGSGSLVNSQGDMVQLGTRPAGQGRITLRNGGRLVAGVDLQIGHRGSGDIQVQSGGLLQISNPSFRTVLGNESTGIGALAISGATTQAELGALIVGSEGKATVTASDLATVQTQGIIVANLKPSVGSVTVADGASWTCASFTNIGGEAPAGPPGVATFSVLNGATFSTGDRLSVAAGSTLKVDATAKVVAGIDGFGPPGTLRIGAQGVLRGKGKVLAKVIVGLGGKLQPGASPGTLTIEGDYTQESGGTLDIELGGTGAKSDLLKISGDAAISGTMNISLANGFNPKAGQKFKILTAKNVTGAFTQVNGGTAEVSDEGITVTPFVPHTTLHLAVNPGAGGAVTDGFLGDTDRVLGYTYTVVATPAAGFVFSNWTGDVTSTNPSLTFAMTDNMMLQANFVADPFASQILGNYGGLAATATADELAAALLNVTINASGAFSAKLTLGGKPYSFGGVFTGLGKYQRQLTLGGKLFDIDLTAALDNSGTVTGTITVNGVAYAATARRGAFTAVQPTDRAGDYTVLFPPNADNTEFVSPRPQGTGWVTVNVKSTGAVKLAGQLSDGLKISAGGTLASDGRVVLLASLYGKLGVFAGTLTFAALPRSLDPMVSDVTGTMTWTKPSQTTNKIFPGSFATTLDAIGAFYDPPAADTRVLTGLSANGNARLQFLGGDLAAMVAKDVVISTSNAVTYPAPTSAADKLKLTFKPKTGAFSGSFLHPGTGKATAFTGAVLRKQQRGGGFFLDATDSGQVELAAP